MLLYENSLSIKILEYLLSVESIPRKELYTPFSEYEYTRYAKTVKRLIEEGYLLLMRKNRLNHVRISKKGTLALSEKLGHEESVRIEKKAKKAKPVNAKARRRQALVAGVMGLCAANGFCVEEKDKPELISLFSMQTSLLDENEQSFEQKLKTGVFYFTSEIRTALISIMGKSEIANWTRLVGVVFYMRHVTFVYSVKSELIKWVPSNEEKTVRTILRFFGESYALSASLTLHERPSCIICGRGFTMIPKIVLGRKWGRIDNEKSDVYRRMIARDHINSHNLGKVFSAAYYVTVDHRGVDDFRIACLLDEKKRDNICDKWFDDVGTATRIKTYAYYQGLTPKRERVIHLPCIDLIELEFYRKQNIPCHFVLPQNTQEAVSRVMGPLLLSARSLTGKKLIYNRYDAFGAKVFKESNR